MGYEDTKLLLMQFQANFTMLSKKFDNMHGQLRDDLKDGLDDLKNDLIRCQSIRDKIVKRIEELEKMGAVKEALEEVKKEEKERIKSRKEKVVSFAIWLLKYAITYVTPWAIASWFIIKQFILGL